MVIYLGVKREGGWEGEKEKGKGKLSVKEEEEEINQSFTRGVE